MYVVVNLNLDPIPPILVLSDLNYSTSRNSGSKRETSAVPLSYLNRILITRQKQGKIYTPNYKLKF
jgi:hypothetical protein